jgi:hypothetical protein
VFVVPLASGGVPEERVGHSVPLCRGLDLGDRTAQQKDDFAVSAALGALVVVAEPPIELRRVVIPLVDADLDDGRSARRGRNQRIIAVPIPTR